MGGTSRLAVYMLTDIVGSTELKVRLGLASYAQILDRHNRLFESNCGGAGGEILKHTGDGFFAAFATASDAVRAALCFVAAMRKEAWRTPIAARIGIHVGEVAVMEMAGRPDIVGVVADITARVMSAAAGGQILMTRGVFNDARQFVSAHPSVDGEAPPALRWVAHGPYLFKGLLEPIELFEVGAEGLAPLSAPPGDAKARRVVPHDQEQTLGWRPAVGLEIPGRPGWELQRKLGEGGFGEVWLGRHERTKERRVFKFCFDAQRLRSFKRELTLVRLLRDALGDRHDIARLYEVKLDEPPYFVESEYTEGGSLTDWLEAQGGFNKVPLRGRIEIIRKIASALAAAHAAGVVHKDIKPGNILIHVESDGTIQPRLSDFGIGLLMDPSLLEQRNITQTGFTSITQNETSRTGTRLYAPRNSSPAGRSRHRETCIRSGC